MRSSKRKWLKVLLVITIVWTTLLTSASIGLQPASAEQLVRKFDFGTATSPVMTDYTGVSDSTLYTAERGYGLSVAVASRMRSGGTDLTNDFVLGTAYSFYVDVPNGEYDVTVMSGDLLTGTSTTKTNIMLEDVAAGTISSRQAVTQAIYRTTVTDGQLTVGISGAGAGGYLNALVIEEVMPVLPDAPADLAVTRVTSNDVTLAWSAVT